MKMRVRSGLTALVFALGCAEGAVGRHAARQHNRDVATTDAATTAASISASTSATSSDQPSATATGESTASTSSTAQPTTAAAGDATSVITLTSGTTDATSVPSAASTSDPSALPFEPRITPALGLTGVILMLAGLALALIGIKHKWLHIFLSTAFLTGLAVTVLIIYVMNPPVSDAVQGAYLVAALFTGLIFGAVSMIFKEVTEGLGCLLGGFCLSMWFLVLRPGGLIPSTAGSAIFIAVFCIICFCLSFSRYTRTYGLIGCTSFAGAMITIIGVDCFSRAGLKEFWLYIWNLNSNEFPLGTETYPITRGIRVEIACTIILFLFGILSQLKIWKIIKERRAQKDAERAEQDESKNQLESEVGKAVESTNERARAQWEAVYGDKTGPQKSQVQTDSGVGSSISDTEKRLSVRERELDEIELSDIPSVKRTNRRSLRKTISARLSSSEPVPKLHMSMGQSNEHLVESRDWHTSARTSIDRRSSIDPDRSTLKEEPETEHAHAGPPIVPLPFTLPEERRGDYDAESDDESPGTPRSALNERVSALSRLDVKSDENDHRIDIPRIEDDRASSIAADIDLLSHPRWSLLPPFDLDKDAPNLASLGINPAKSSHRLSRQTLGEVPIDEDDEEELVRPPTVLGENRPIASRISHRPGRASVGSIDEDDAETYQEDGDMSAIESLQQHLPRAESRIAMTYRTNEWAKHIAEAEEPENEAAMEGGSPGIKVDPVFAEEAVRAVDTEALQRDVATESSSLSNRNPYKISMQKSEISGRPSAGAATPVYAFQRSGSQASVRPSGNTAAERSNSQASIARHASNPVVERNVSQVSTSRQNSYPAVERSASQASLSRHYNVERSSSQMSMNRQHTNNPIVERSPSKLALRSGTPLMTSTVVESPAEDSLATSPSSYRNLNTPLGMTSANNLMDQRNDRLQHRPQTTSFMALSTATPNLNLIAASEVGSVRAPSPLPIEDDGGEDMTLAQRKALIQTSRPPSALDNIRAMSPPPQATTMRSSSATPNGRRPSNPLNSPPSRSNSRARALSPIDNPAIIYDSHQPHRTNTVDAAKQSAMLTQWRESLQVVPKEQPFVQGTPAAGGMLGALERQRADENAKKEAEEREREKRESKRLEAMRSGALYEAHRDKLSRMQAQVGKK